MATTTNYGWTTPDDTALVKDGASAIRTLGSSVDTTTKNLNPETTLGDIAYRSSSSNVNTRLGIGTTGQLLTVSGGVPTWATPTPGGGITLLSTTTLSGATTTVSSISASYQHLFVSITALTNATAGGRTRVAPNGSTNISSAYNASATPGEAVDTYMFMSDNGFNVNRTEALNTFTFTIYDYASTTTLKTFFAQCFYSLSGYSNTLRGFIGGGGINTTSAISSLVFSNSGGDCNGGTVKIYGVK